MKKLKLLSSLSALLLVLSVGACDKNVTEDSSSDEVTSSESGSSTSSSETTPAPVELSNYTISITFVDAEGETTAIPEYGTAYIIGGWDSWATFIPLTENEGKYTHTFDTITEGSYGYKVVEWYTDEDVDWNSATETNCVEITATDQTLVVSGSEGDNATHEITITLDVVLPPLLTDEDIIAGILGAASQVSYPEEIGWTAYHFESVEDDETDIYDMTENGEKAYGRWVNIDDEEQATVRYIVDGTQYIYDASDDEEPYTTNTFSESFDWALENWYPCEPLERVASYGDDEDPLDLEAFDSVTLTKGLQDYTLVLEESDVWSEEDGSDNETYTIVTDFSFNLIGLAYEENDNDELTSHSAEKISAAEVEAIIDAVDFGPWIYDTDEDPVAAMFEAIGQGQNYTLTIEYYDWYSNYYEDYNQMRNEYVSGDMSVWGHDYYVVLTYTEEAVLMEYYTSYIEMLLGYVYDVELYVNGEDGLQIYYVNYDEYVDEETGEVDYDELDYTNLYLDDTVEDSTWQDEFWTLLDLADYASNFVKGETSVGGRNGTTTNYSVNFSYSFMNTLCNCMFEGGNWFGDYFSYFLYYWALYYMYYGITPTISATYYADYEEFDVSAVDFVTWTYTDSETGGKIYQMEYDSVYASISDVGTSAISEAYTSYLQA